MVNEKALIRTSILAIKGDWSKEDEKSVQLLLASPLLRDADRVFAFVPLASEVDISALLDVFPLALPLCVNGQDMEFVKMPRNWHEAVRKGKLGIKEPTEGEIVYPSVKSVILVPAVAFTAKGDRLGRGKGYYDRYLSRFPQVVSIGICRSYQVLQDLPSSKFDRKVTHLVVKGKWVL